MSSLESFTKALSLCIAAALLPSSSAEDYDIYLLAGQSNMDGRGLVSELPDDYRTQIDNAIIFYRNSKGATETWQPLAPGFCLPPKHKGGFPSPTFGPEIAFARSMLQEQSQRKIALIKGSQGGTSLRADWAPGKKEAADSQGPQYRDFIETIRTATKQLRDRGATYTFRGLLWHQGESDKKSSTQTYSHRLNELIARLREDIETPDLPVVVGEVFDNGERDNVRKAIQEVAASSHTVGLVSSDGTTTSDPGTHFDTRSQLVLGKRYADAMTELLSPKLKRAPSSKRRAVASGPNVLFIAIDDLNDWEGGLNRNPQAKMPHMDRLFRQGLLFTKCSLFAGRVYGVAKFAAQRYSSHLVRLVHVNEVHAGNLRSCDG